MWILILKVVSVCWLTKTCLNLLVGQECTKGAAGSVHLCINKVFQALSAHGLLWQTSKTNSCVP